MAASSYSFPVLTRKEIATVLLESQLAENITEQNLINPTPELVTKLYTNLLSNLDPLQGDDHGQLDFHALGHLENPDHHGDSVKVINLLHKVNEVIAAVHCPVNFNLKDLVKPDSQRTVVFLSAILNFTLYRDTKLNLIHPYVAQIGVHEEKKAELETRISQVKMEIEQVKDAREREKPFVLELDAEVKDLRQTIQVLNNQQMSLKTSFRALREKTKEMDEKITTADFTLSQSAQENAKLQSKIVQSPEKLQGALEEKKSIRDEVKNSERSAMRFLNRRVPLLKCIQSWLCFPQAGKKMKKRLAQMQAIQEQVTSAKKIDKDVKVLKAKLSDMSVLDKSLEAKLVERQAKAEQLEESRKALEEERDLKHAEDTRSLKSVKSEVELKKRDMASRGKRVEAMNEEVDNIKLKMNSVRESGAAAQQELFFKCKEIVKEFQNNSHTIGVVLQRIEPGLENV
ncbi:hypothetical protein IFM89_037304 [Coptis chinensis]|uniref:Kinetochore protein Nuf2 N-terminal domain-containing protein n=1 Tax=Coptis chinensis TaxID=261450 RepID=A0A835I773_9MAGN|nr:hypothetical protein IFM89_037304 [Coptis chinensis]